jgi:small subunit ribosomal protein S4e
MGKKGGDTRVKRQLAPTFWTIKRKESQFVLRVRPGPHPMHRAYPLGMVLRDVLRMASTMHEAERILNAGKVKVDCVVRRDSNLAIGLMDIIELQTGKAYRMVPKDSALLASIAIEDSEKEIKLVRVTSKTIIKGKRIQYGFHDGKTMISEQKFKVGDSCVIDMPKVQVKNHVAFEKGSTVLIITGENAGKIGQVEDIKDGIFSLPKRVLVSFENKSVELPVEMVMVVGKEKPVIKVN